MFTSKIMHQLSPNRCAKHAFAASVAIAAFAAPAFASAATHHLMVYANAATKSIYISTVRQDVVGRVPFAACRELSNHSATIWLDGKQDLLNGAPVQITTFTSTDCGAGYQKRSPTYTVPGNDGLANFYIDVR